MKKFKPIRIWENKEVINQYDIRKSLNSRIIDCLLNELLLKEYYKVRLGKKE